MEVNGATFKAINLYLGYELPIGTNRLAATIKNPPNCLAYIEVGNKCILLRKNFTGSDNAGRIGTYFIHLLDALTDDFTARDAIELWDSTFWKTTVPDSNDTPDFKDSYRYELWPVDRARRKPDSLTVGEIGRDADLIRYLPLVIEAYLCLDEQKKLCIAPDPPHVAKLLW